MRVVQLGCGITGLVCAEELSKNKKVSELVLADIDIAPAQALAGRLGSDKIVVTKTDAREEKNLKRLIRDADLLISSVSWMLGQHVIKMAAKTNTNYVEFSMGLPYDFIDKPEKYIGKTEATILSCMGEDPGITDVFARHSANLLERVDRIRVMDGDNGSAEGCKFFSLWSPQDLMDELATPAGVFKDGKMITIPPLSSSDVYEFPEPIGKLKVFNTDHEETHLISRLIKGVKDVDFRIAIDEEFVNVVRALQLVGMHRRDEIDVHGVKVRPIDVLTALMPKPTDLIGKIKGHAAIVVETTGMKSGKKTMIKMSLMMSHEKAYELAHSNATGYLVGMGGAIGAEMLLDGIIDRKGAVFPEQVDSEEFLRRMRQKGLMYTEQTVSL
ncbi:MAG: saccharopine dehydrogenase C-terminal domain-containing protein [Thermoplasmata archaeon]